VALAPPPPAAVTPPASVQGAGGAFVQLAALRDEAGARSAWSRIVAKHPDLFAGRSLVLVQADVGGTTYYRVRTGPFESRAAAAAFCAKLKRQGQDCIPAGS
jgi:cell division septation protein DedD